VWCWFNRISRNQKTLEQIQKIPLQTFGSISEKDSYITSIVSRGNYIYISAGNTVFRIDTNTFEQQADFFLRGHTDVVTNMAVIFNEIWTASADATIRSYNPDKRECTKVMKCDQSVNILLKVGWYVWAAGKSSNISIWNVKTGKLEKTTEAQPDILHENQITSLVLVWNRTVWSGSLDKSVSVWA